MVKITDPLYPVFKRVLAKHRKFDLTRKSDFKANESDDVVGNESACGNPGYAKTSYNRRKAELRFDLGHKEYLLYDGGERMDMAFMMFPSTSDFWKVPKCRMDRRGRTKIITARGYPTKCFIPITKHFPKNKKGRCIIPTPFIPFTIAVCDLDKDDLVALVGKKFEDTINAAYSFMQERVNEDTTPWDYIKMLSEALQKGVDGVKLTHYGVKKLIGDVFMPLMNEGILSTKKASTNLDLLSDLKDKGNISILILRHCPKHLHGFLVHYFMNHISQLLSGRGSIKKVKQKTTIILNEMSSILSKDNEEGSSSYAISKMVGNILKQSRTTSIYLLGDTQLPNELPEVKDTLKRIALFNSSLASLTSAMNIIGISENVGEINRDDHAIIPRLGKGWYYLFDRDNGVSIHKLVWGRSRTWLDGEDFYEVYDKFVHKNPKAYYDVTDKINECKEILEESKKLWKKKKQIEQQETKPKGRVIKSKEIEKEVDEEDEEEKIEEKIEEVKEKPKLNYKEFAKLYT